MEQTNHRTGKELIAASKEYAVEDRGKSWALLLSTVAIHAAVIAIAALAPFWPLRLFASVVAGLVTVRVFIFYHDHLHMALLRSSPVAKAILYVYGCFVLTPPTVWRATHNYHHAHTAKLIGSHVGSYAMVSVDIWKQMSRGQRLMYKAIRHPLNVLFAYFTIFALGMCVAPFKRNPKKHWDAPLALLLHVAAGVAIVYFAGFATAVYAYFLPVFIACAAGAYLFYVQHNFPDIYVQPRESWSYDRAALESSSYLELSPLMHWFTGNIGYHHVHHLNPNIPFYRLPEAMAGMPELQHPGKSTLSPKDIAAAFRLKLWDPALGRMVGYPKDGPEAARPEHAVEGTAASA